MQLHLLLICLHAATCYIIQRTQKIETKKKPSFFRELIRGEKIPTLPKLDKVPALSKSRSLKVPQEAEFDPCSTSRTICLNDGKCLSKDGMFTCICPSTHYGKRCEILADLKYCEDNKCKNNAVCVSIPHPKEVINPGSQFYSENTEREVLLEIQYDCFCPPGFSGIFCEISDEELSCREEYCMNHGTGVFIDGICKCDCHSDYIGERCETENPCSSIICANSGKCITEVDETENIAKASCQCSETEIIPSKVSGPLCETIEIMHDIFLQSQYMPCRSGGNRISWTKSMKSSVILTVADSQYLNELLNNCRNEKNMDCSNHPLLQSSWCIGEMSVCEPRGVKFPSGKTYLYPFCICHGSDDGPFCEYHREDECDPRKEEVENGITRRNRCTDLDHGVCVDILGEPKCDCRKGFVGEMCEVYDPCLNTPCKNAECVAIPSETFLNDNGQLREAYRCLCNMEDERIDAAQCVYSGTGNCSSPERCHNGLCISCEHFPEDSMLQMCTTREQRDGFRCICEPGYELPYCQAAQNPCFEHLCENSGECRRISKYDYECVCNPGTKGTLCEEVTNYCLAYGDIRCLHGVCEEDVRSLRGFSCICNFGYYGTHCELEMSLIYSIYTTIMMYYKITLPLISLIITISIFVLISSFCELTESQESAKMIEEPGKENLFIKKNNKKTKIKTRYSSRFYFLSQHSFHLFKRVFFCVSSSAKLNLSELKGSADSDPPVSGFHDDDLQITESVSTVVTPNCSDPEDDDNMLGPLKRPGEPFSLSSKRSKPSILPLTSNIEIFNPEATQTLLAMGFSEALIPNALRLAGGDLERAVLYLTGEMTGLEDIGSSQIPGMVNHLEDEILDPDEDDQSLQMPSTSLASVQSHCYQGRSLFYKSGHALDRCIKAACRMCENDIEIIDQALDEFLVNILPETISKHASPPECSRMDADAIDIAYNFYKAVIPLLTIALQRRSATTAICRSICDLLNSEGKYLKATRRRDSSDHLDLLLTTGDVFVDREKLFSIHSCGMSRLQEAIEHFCRCGGFSILDEMIKKLPIASGESVEAMCAFLQVANVIVPYLLTPKYEDQSADWMDRVLDLVDSLQEKQIRSSYARTCVLEMIDELNKLTYHMPSTEHRGENGRIDIARLDFLLKCLKCSQLEARMFALNDLCHVASNAKSTNPIIGEELFNGWLKENKILHLVLNGNLDMAAYADKTNKILAYMAPIMSNSDLAYIWSLRKGRLGVSAERFQSLVSHITSQFSIKQMEILCTFFRKAFDSGENRTFEKVFNICSDIAKSSEDDDAIKMILYEMWDYIMIAKSRFFDVSNALDIHSEIISFKKNPEYRDDFVKRSLDILVSSKVDNDKNVLPILFVVYIRNVLSLGPRESLYSQTNMVTRKAAVLRGENNAWGDLSADLKRKAELKKLLVEQNLYHIVIRNIMKCQRIAHSKSLELQDCVIPGENSRSCFEQEDLLEPVLMDVSNGYTYSQVLQFSLKLITWMLENDVIAFTLERINPLWKCLVEREHSSESEKTEFFHWITRIRKDVICDDILLELLSMFTKLNYDNFTLDGARAFLEIYHRLFVSANEPRKEELRHHWNSLWLILENAQDVTVVDQITCKIVKEGVYGDKISAAPAPFVEFCFNRLNELRQSYEAASSASSCPDVEVSQTYLRKVHRILSVLARYTSAHEETFTFARARNLHGSVNPGRPLRIDMYCDTLRMDKRLLSISTHTNELLANFKERIDSRLSLYNVDTYTMHVNWSEEDKEISMRHPWKTLEQIGIVPSNDDVFYANYGVLRVRLFIKNINSLRSPPHRITFDTSKEKEDELPSALILKKSGIFTVLYNLPSTCDKKVTAVCRMLLSSLPNDIAIEKAFTLQENPVFQSSEQEKRPKCYTILRSYEFQHLDQIREILSLDNPQKCLYGLEVLSGILMPTRSSLSAVDKSRNTITALLKSDILDYIVSNIQKVSLILDQNRLTEDSVYADIVDRTNVILRYVLLNKSFVQDAITEDSNILEMLEPVPSADEVGIKKRKDHLQNMLNIFDSRKHVVKEWTTDRIEIFVDTWISIITSIRVNQNHLLINLTEAGVDRFSEEVDRDVFTIDQALCASKDILASRKKLSFISSKLSVDCLRLQLEVIREWVEHSNTESYYQLLSNFFFIENWQQFVKTVLLDGKDNLLRHVACYYLVSILKLCKMGVSALCMSNIYELLVPVLCNEKTSSQLDSTELAQRQNSLDLTRCISTVLVSTSLSGDDDDVTLWNLVIEAAIELVVPLTEKVLSYELSRSFEAIDGALLSSQMEMIRGLIGSGNLSEQTVLEVGDFIITKLVNGKLFPGYHVNEDNFTDLSSLSPPSRWNDFGVRRQAVYLLLELASTNHGKNAIRLLEKLHMRYENECISGWEFEPDIEEKSYNRVGLKNDGGTCYMNSILQQIFAISTISKQFVSLNVNSSLEWENGLKSSLLLEIQRVFAHLYFLLEKVCVPRGIWNVFCFSGEDQLDTKRQHDAIDFFTELVDRCDTVMEKLKQPLLFKPQLSGKFAYEYICYECYTRHQGPEEEYLTVNLELHGTSLEDCLQHYVDGEILEGENAYHCRECNSKRTTLRRGSFYSLPPTLSIQLKRFTFDFTGRQAQKNNEYCKFPEFLDMNPYMKHAQTFDTKDIDLLFEEIHATQKQGSTTKMSSTPHPSPSSPMKMRRRRRISTLPAQQVNPEDFHYELVGVLAHSGLAAAGHYYSFVKDHESDPRKPKWYELNDSHVKTFDIATEAEQTWFGGHFRAAKGSSLGLPEERTRTWNAYVLFYQKVKKAPTDFSKMSLTSTMHKNAAISDVFLSMPQWLRSEIINKNSRFVKERDLYSDEYRDLMLETAHNFYTSLCHMNIPKEEARSREDMCIQALKFIVSFCYRILWRLSSDFRNSAVLEKAQNVILQLLTYNYNVRKSYLVFLSEDNYKVFDALCCCPSRTVFRSFFESLSFVLVTWSTCDKGSVSEREFTFLRKSITLLKSEFYNNIDNTETILDMLCRIGETELGLKTFWEYEIPSALCELVVVVYDNDHLPRLRVQDKELKADKLKAIPILFLDVLYYGMFHCGQLEEIRLTLSNISVHYLLTWIYCVSSDAPHIGDKIIEILAVADEKLGVQFTTSRINALLHWVTNQVILPGYWESIINLIKHTTLVRQKLGHADCGRALCLFLDEQEVASAEDRSIHSGIIPWLEHMISKGAYNLCADMTRALDNLYSNNSAISEIFNSRAERIKIIGQRIEEFAYDSQVNGVYETSACSRENLHGTFLRDENAPELLDISNIEPIPMQRSKARLDDMDPMEIDCQPASPSSFSATALVTSSSEDLDFKHIM